MASSGALRGPKWLSEICMHLLGFHASFEVGLLAVNMPAALSLMLLQLWWDGDVIRLLGNHQGWRNMFLERSEIFLTFAVKS